MDFRKPIEEMTDAELREYIRTVYVNLTKYWTEVFDRAPIAVLASAQRRALANARADASRIGDLARARSASGDLVGAARLLRNLLTMTTQVDRQMQRFSNARMAAFIASAPVQMVRDGLNALGEAAGEAWEWTKGLGTLALVAFGLWAFGQVRGGSR